MKRKYLFLLLVLVFPLILAGCTDDQSVFGSFPALLEWLKDPAGGAWITALALVSFALELSQKWQNVTRERKIQISSIIAIAISSLAGWLELNQEVYEPYTGLIDWVLGAATAWVGLKLFHRINKE